MKKWKQLTCILLVVLLLLNCCPPAKADDRQTLTLFCFSTEMEHGLPVSLMLKDGLVYIKEDSLAQISGFACTGDSMFQCENRAVSLKPCRLGDEPWYIAEAAFDYLDVRAHKVNNSLFFEAAGAARARAQAQAEMIMFTESYRYRIQTSDAENIGVILAMMYDALSGKSFSMMDGRYQSEHIREVLVDLLTVGEDEAGRLAIDFNSAMEELTCWSDLVSAEDWADLPDDLKLLSLYEGISDPVSALTEAAGAELKGFGLGSQLKIMQYLQSLAFVSELQLDCFQHVLADNPNVVNAARSVLPADCSPLIDEMCDTLRFYQSKEYSDVLVELVGEELETITKETFEVGTETIVETLTGTKLASIATKIARVLLDRWLPAGKQMDLTMKIYLLSKIQRITFSIYCVYCQLEGSEINQKYAAILYLKCCAMHSQYCSAVDSSINFERRNATIEKALSGLIQIPDKLLLEGSGDPELDLTSFFRSRQDDADHTGVWINDNSSNHSIHVLSQDGQTVSIEVTSTKPTGTGGGVSAIDITAIEDIVLYNGVGAKEYVDSFGNEGILYLMFSGDSLTAEYRVLTRSPGRWGIDYGAGRYHRADASQTSSLTNGQYYARITGAESADGGSVLLHTVVLNYDSFQDSDVAGLAVGDAFSANGAAYTVESGNFADGEFSLGSTRLIRTLRGDWIVVYPSAVPVLYELGAYDFLIPATMTMAISPIYAQNFPTEDGTASVADLFSRYGDTLQNYRYLLTIENDVVVGIELPYMP